MDRHDDLVVALTPLTDVLERLGVAWYVGGSVASTVHGRFRATNDVDVIADLLTPLSIEWIDADTTRTPLTRRYTLSAPRIEGQSLDPHHPDLVSVGLAWEHGKFNVGRSNGLDS